MSLAVALSAAATLVAIAFCMSTFERWTRQRRRQDAAWSVSLAMFAVAAGALWLGLSTGWNEVIFRIYYLFGAVLNVPVLALGTLYLLGNQRLVDKLALGMALWLSACTGVVLATPFTGDFRRRSITRWHRSSRLVGEGSRRPQLRDRSGCTHRRRDLERMALEAAKRHKQHPLNAGDSDRQWPHRSRRHRPRNRRIHLRGAHTVRVHDNGRNHHHLRWLPSDITTPRHQKRLHVRSTNWSRAAPRSHQHQQCHDQRRSWPHGEASAMMTSAPPLTPRSSAADRCTALTASIP